jgi:hypothetical protein
MNKIISRIFGGIGNQLFCYAAARRLALVNGAELVIDEVSGFAYDKVYKQRYQLDHFSIPCRKATAAERMEPFSRVRRYFKRAYNRRRPFEERSYIQQEGIDFDPRLLQVKAQDTLYLEGYWQSEKYFKDMEETIRADLCIQPPTDERNRDMAARIRESLAVAVHVRFFDALNETFVNNTPGDYYARAVEKMETLVPGAHYFVFSDQPEVARGRIPLPDARITLVSHNCGDDMAYADLWLMSQCKHFIIANSTFSWWGAWLADNSVKYVIAPGFEIIGSRRVTSWGFEGLLPAKWIKL